MNRPAPQAEPPARLLAWAKAAGALPQGGVSVSGIAGDASSRRYYRANWPDGSCILMHAPPATEKNHEFLAVRELLSEHGLRVPALYAVDIEAGFMALEDLGDRMLLSALSADSAAADYSPAFELLTQLALIQLPEGDAFPAYDEALLTEELSRFPLWFAESLLQYSLSSSERELFGALSKRLITNALAQPQVVVHRDFHSRNLMCLEPGGLALIDFQDAVRGPLTYDLVSLLRDCYIRWPEPRVRDWALAHRDRLVDTGLVAPVSDDDFLLWFDLQGLQRHIKVLGTFARLYLRDQKAAYLADLPRVVDYIRQVCAARAASEPDLAAFIEWFERALMPQFDAQPWSTGA
ncbi:MAG: phosphotransferase [Pseudomonadota bacterium]